ncbi:helix-turn-helix domain-containing protein [Bacillus anthracis]|nr:helix-turn-helix domain-containing protein [Bacillus thuringiensis]MEB9684695.1 helix-turn-helix domain-containing protein [Bacillus anthracis]
MVNKANKFHIYLNKVQVTLFNKTIGYSHFVSNPFLSYTIEIR